MDRKKLVLLLGALIIAVGTALAARSLFSGASAPEVVAAEPQPEGPKVLVANRGLGAGTIITADAVGFQQWPEELVQDAYYIEGESDFESLIGTVVRLPITAGQPLTVGALVKPGDRGFLAAALGPGMRAVTVPVSERTGVAGFIFPGDRVDLMLTQTVDGVGRPLKAAETVLRNLRVLATDQTTEQYTNDQGKTIVRNFNTVTLEVTPQLAEKIAVAQTIGTLSLVLRSLADNQAELERAIASGQIKIPEDATPEEEERILRTAMAKPSAQRTSFQTGGDVSRFERKTLPEDEEAAQRRRAEEEMRRRIEQQRALAAARNAGMLGGSSGPIVRVVRGGSAREVEVGGGANKANAASAGASNLLKTTARGVGAVGDTAPAAAATLIK